MSEQRIFIKTTLDDKIFPLEYNVNETISSLKRKMAEQSCVDLEDVCFVFNGKKLDKEDLTLQEYEIWKESVVHAVIPPVFRVEELSALKGKPSGEYHIQFSPNATSQRMYADLSDPDQIWVRLCMKTGQEVQGQLSGKPWTVEKARALRLCVKDFGVSDNPLTIHTSESWIVKDVSLSACRTLSYLKWEEADVDLYLCNVLNGLTPSGTQWSLGYDTAYVMFWGLFQTYGTWRSMYVGANWTSYSNVGDQISLRCGGHIYHTGEFIHTTCNGYGSQDHSVTSRANWNNTRIFWFRISSPQQ